MQARHTEQDQRTERHHDGKRVEPAARIAADPHRSEEEQPKADGEQRLGLLRSIICIEHLLDGDLEEATESERQ